MMRWHETVLLLADRSGADRLDGRAADGWHGLRGQSESTQLIAILVGMGVVVLLVWFLTSFSNGRRHAAMYRSPRRMFLALAKAHRLTWRETWLLWRLARWHNLEAPARIFLEPECFDREGLSRWLARRVGRIQLLRGRLFGNIAELEAKPPASVASNSPLPAVAASGAELVATDLVHC